MPKTLKEATQFVGEGGDVNYDGQQIVEASGSYQAWARTRSFEELLTPVFATVTDNDGNEETVETSHFELLQNEGVSVPDGFEATDGEEASRSDDLAAERQRKRDEELASAREEIENLRAELAAANEDDDSTTTPEETTPPAKKTTKKSTRNRGGGGS